MSAGDNKAMTGTDFTFFRGQIHNFFSFFFVAFMRDRVDASFT